MAMAMWLRLMIAATILTTMVAPIPTGVWWSKADGMVAAGTMVTAIAAVTDTAAVMDTVAVVIAAAVTGAAVITAVAADTSLPLAGTVATVVDMGASVVDMEASVVDMEAADGASIRPHPQGVFAPSVEPGWGVFIGGDKREVAGKTLPVMINCLHDIIDRL